MINFLKILFKNLKYLFFLCIVLTTSNVFASADINVNQYVRPTKTGSTYKYYGLESYLYGEGQQQYTLGTRYNGRLSQLDFVIYPYGFESGSTYTISLNMATDDWRNNFGGLWVWNCNQTMTNTNAIVKSVSYISMKKIRFSYSPSETTSCLRILIRSKNQSSSEYFTGVNNWNLNSVIITDPAYSSGGGSSGGGSTSTPTPTPQPNNQDIINNANANTNDIINNANDNTNDVIENNNSNTQSIIENNNSNTQSIIDSNKVCNVYDKSSVELDNKYLNDDSSISSLTGFGISNYIKISKNGTLKVLSYRNDTASFCFYDVNKLAISCIVDNTVSSGEVITIPDNATYFRFSIHKNNNRPTFEYCENGNQALTDTIQDDSIDDKTSFFTDFNNDTHGLTGIITLPLTTIQSLANTSCVSLSIPIPYTNEHINLPCMTEVYQTYIPSVFSIWQVVSFGIISYLICLDIFKIVKGFKDPNEDKIEVMDL